MRRTQIIRIALLVSLLLTPGAGVHAVAVAPIALGGTPAAGAPEGATWQYVSTPRVNDLGQLLFTGNLTPGTGGVTSDDDSAMWGPGQSGHLIMFGREGSHPPGTPPGTLFESAHAPYLNDAGRIAFRATLEQAQGLVSSTNDTGIWATSNPGEFVLRIREGDPSPAGEPFGEVGGVAALGASGELIFPSWLSQQTAIWWLSPSDQPVLLLRGGEQVEGAPPGANFATNHGDPIRLNGSGEIVLRASLETWSGGVDGDSNRIILRGTAESGLSMVAREGDPVPAAIPGAVFADAFSNPMLNGAGDMALLGGLRVGTGGVTSDDDDVIWLFGREGHASVIAREGEPAPGAPDGAVYSQLRHVSLNDSGQVAFNGRLAVGPGGVVAGEEKAIWGPGPDGELTMLVRDGDPVPGRPAGVRFTGIDHGPLLNNRGDVVFEASWEEGTGENAVWRTGIFAVDAVGEAHSLLRWDEAIELAPGDVRTVSAFQFVDAASSVTGRRGLNDRGQLAAWIEFTDYSHGVFLISIDELECSDGVDNDGDGLVDFRDDPGCLLPISPTESPACDDGEDNDGDGLVDYGEDPQCATPWLPHEQPPCGLGVELVLALGVLAGLRHPSVAAVRSMGRKRRPIA
jgi:hypothetical protein